MEPRQLSRELREGQHKHLTNRRRVVALSLTAAGSMGVITLYQMGLIRHLPEPRLPGLNADKVDAAPQAYEKLSMPDAALGLTGYAVTLSLAAAGGKERARTRPWLPLLLAGKAAFDAAQAGKLTVDQWRNHRAFCSWCLLAAGATFAALPLVWPEARDAARRITGGRRAAARRREAAEPPQRVTTRRSPETWPQRGVR